MSISDAVTIQKEYQNKQNETELIIG